MDGVVAWLFRKIKKRRDCFAISKNIGGYAPVATLFAQSREIHMMKPYKKRRIKASDIKEENLNALRKEQNNNLGAFR